MYIVHYSVLEVQPWGAKEYPAIIDVLLQWSYLAIF